MSRGPQRIAVVVGTRPEAIKLAPVVLALSEEPGVDCRVCVTGQHRHMVAPVLELFGIAADADLGLMRPEQTLAELTARSVEAIDGYLARERPDLVLVQGDTTSVLAAALAAFYRRIAVGHVEAGLRTRDKYAPFPEEINRRLVAPIADVHFAPTARARRTLLGEGVPEAKVFLTGNTVVDALHWVRERNRRHPPELPPAVGEALEAGRMILVTGHRRESFGPRFEAMCRAMQELAEEEGVAVVYPVHLNPNVQRPVRRLLEGVPGVVLLDPVTYPQLVALLERCHFVLTDSGGIQEEAPALGKPVLVMRDTTERPEGVEAGNARLVGSDRRRIVGAARELLHDDAAYREMAQARNPYGDGRAARRIADVLRGRTFTPWEG